MRPDDALRQRAEARLRIEDRKRPARQRVPAAREDLVHDLQVHQVELELQNDELRRRQAELEESRARYADLVEQAPVGLLRLDGAGRILEANRRAAARLGAPDRRVVGEALASFVVPGDQDRYHLYRRRLGRGGEPEACDLRLTAPGGGEGARVRLEGQALGAAGSPSGYRLTLGTPGELPEPREVQPDGEALLADVLRHYPIPAFVLDPASPDLRLLAASDGFPQLTGSPAGPLLAGRPAREVFPPELVARIATHDGGRAAGPAAGGIEHYRGGRAFITTLFPVAVGPRRLVGGLTLDVSVRRGEQAALRGAEASLRAICENVHQRFEVLEPDHGLRLFSRAASDAAARTTGRPLAVGEPLEAWLEEAGREAFAARFRRALGGEHIREPGWPPGSGAEEYFTPLLSGSGQVVGVLHGEVDAGRAAEPEPGERRPQPERAGTEEALAAMARGVAQQLNNRLTVIIGLLDLARAQVTSGPRALLDDVDGEVLRLAGLGQRLLQCLGEGVGRRQPRPLGTVLMDALPDLVASLPPGVHLELEVAADLPWCSTEPAALREVLRQLVANAAEATAPRGGLVSLAARRIDGPEVDAVEGLRELGPAVEAWACVEIRDQGPGMSAATLERAFDPYFSTHLTGRGLGLAVAKGLVRTLGGLVRLASAAHQGTTATVYLPESPAGDD